VNILKKQSQIADNGRSSSLGLGRGVTNNNHKKHLVTKCSSGPCEHGMSSGVTWGGVS
jgi:hypothetical protein